MKTKGVEFFFAQVDLIVEEYSDYVYLSSIVVRDNQRNEGHGTKALEEVIKYAETVRKPLLAFVTSELGGQLDRLTKWYTKFGFYEEYNLLNTNYNYNFRKDF